MTIPTKPKGTRDFFPEENAQQEFIFASWRRTCRRYGFESYEGPMFESLDLFTHKSGDEIEDQLYSFQDKKERKIALRPEMTPTLARMVAKKGSHIRMPLRWFSIPRLFRYENVQKGRLREFFQLNMDILGVAEVSADAELIAAAIDMMRDLGFTSEDFKVRISSRTLLEEIFIVAGLPKDCCPPLFMLLDKKSKIPLQAFTEELTRIVPEEAKRNAITAVFDIRTLADIKEKHFVTPALNELEKLFETLSWYGLDDYVLFDIGIVRGLAYYTGIVFEIIDSKQSLRAIAGGGRYDKHLVEMYGGPKTPAVGFAAGDVVLADFMKEKNLLPSNFPARIDFYLIAEEGSRQSDILALAKMLRDFGFACEFSLKKATVDKQWQQANAARSPYAIFVSGSVGKSLKIKIKNMASGKGFIQPQQLFKNISTEKQILPIDNKNFDLNFHSTWESSNLNSNDVLVNPHNSNIYHHYTIDSLRQLYEDTQKRNLQKNHFLH